MKVVLLILMMTTEGPAITEIASFDPNKKGYCDAIGQLVVANIKEQENVTAAMYRCVERTDV